MSAIALVFQLLFAFLGFLLSLKGILFVLLGILLFIALPIIPRVTGEFQSLARFHHWLATRMLGRLAIVVSEHGDLLWKNMTFDDLGVETITFDDDTKEFEDPDDALHYWMNIPFALADEVHGVLFDPRHSALGNRKHALKERGEYTVDATQDEWNEHNVHKWKRGVFAFPHGVYDLVNLTGVRHLVDGGERAEYPSRIETIYKYSRDPFKSGASTTKIIMLLAAICLPFGFLWLLANQGGAAGGGSNVSYNSLLLLGIGLRDSLRSIAGRLAGIVRKLRHMVSGLASSTRAGAGDASSRVDWQRAFAVFAVVAIPAVAFMLAFVYVSPLTTIFATAALALGFTIPVLVTVFVRPVAKLAGGYARLLLQLGFLGYERPVFEWTPEKYVLKEYDDLETTNDVTWYGLSGALVGFTFTPGPESWGPEVVDRERLTAPASATDGGDPVDSNLPDAYRPYPQLRRGHSYAGFVPKRLDPGSYYLNTGIATGRFADSAVGEKGLRRLLWAKEEHGDDGSGTDRTLVYAMAFSSIASFIAGIVVFFL